MDKRIFSIVAILFVVLTFANAYPNVQWQIISTKRAIYELNLPADINTDQETFVIVEFNIPQEFADDFYNKYIATGYFCSAALQSNGEYWYYPRVFYFSTQNTNQREKKITVIDTYDYTGCDGNVIHYPKEVRITLSGSEIDGGTTYSDYQHYFAVYEPAGIYIDGTYRTVGQPTVPVYLPISDFRDVVLRVVGEREQVSVTIHVRLKYGSEADFYNPKCISGPNNLWFCSLYSALGDANRPLSDLDAILSVHAHSYYEYSGNTYVRDLLSFQLIPFKPNAYP